MSVSVVYYDISEVKTVCQILIKNSHSPLSMFQLSGVCVILQKKQYTIMFVATATIMFLNARQGSSDRHKNVQTNPESPFPTHSRESLTASE